MINKIYQDLKTEIRLKNKGKMNYCNLTWKHCGQSYATWGVCINLINNKLINWNFTLTGIT